MVLEMICGVKCMTTLYPGVLSRERRWCPREKRCTGIKHADDITLGTTLAEGQMAGGGAGEHMTSFDYAYKLEAVRDRLFAQSK